jgi:hypothetical protein
MTKRKRKQWPTLNYCPLHSWQPDRRASRAHIVEAVREAIEYRKRIDALTPGSEAYKRQCGLMQIWANDRRNWSLHRLARENLEYWRMRAFMSGAYGRARTGDRPAAEKWDRFAASIHA